MSKADTMTHPGAGSNAGSTTASTGSTASGQSVHLIVRRTIRADPERLFEAWTRPAHLEKWWGPRDVECFGTEVDLRVGGHYRIGNRFPDGKVVWIQGEFEQISPPHKLVYTWNIDAEPDTGTVAGTAGSERVTVKFEPVRGADASADHGTSATEVIVIHERIGDPVIRESHERGWHDCLDGLAEFAAV